MKSLVHQLRFNPLSVALVAAFVGALAWSLHSAQVVAGLTLTVAHNLLQLGGLSTVPLQLGVVADEQDVNKQILRALGEMSDRFKRFDGVAEEMKVIKEEQAKAQTTLTEFQKTLLAYQKHQIEKSAGRDVRRSFDGISDHTAKFLGGLYMLGSIEQAGKNMNSSTRELYRNEIKSILGIDIESKTALTSSDIPLPVAYSGDVVELVYQYGVARKVGTVLPLGGATFKLPKLSTSTTFSLIAGSGTVTEKSPATAWVTFTPEKFGGLVRMPSEIEEDSIVGMGQFLARYCARQIAQVEDYNFFRSTGGASGQDGTAEGLTKSVVTDTKFYYNGGTSSSGKTKQSDATLADFRTLRTVPSGAVLGRAKYFVHPTYESLFCSFNTSTSVTPYLAMGPNGPTLDGFPIVWVPDMPAYSTSASASLVHALFGDATFHYLGIRGGVRFDTSREAGFTTDEVLVRCLERLTVGKMATDCVAGLRNSAT